MDTINWLLDEISNQRNAMKNLLNKLGVVLVASVIAMTFVITAIIDFIIWIEEKIKGNH